MSINQVAEHTGINRVTVSKYLLALQFLGKIRMKEFGMSKVYYAQEFVCGLCRQSGSMKVFDTENGLRMHKMRVHKKKKKR